MITDDEMNKMLEDLRNAGWRNDELADELTTQIAQSWDELRADNAALKDAIGNALPLLRVLYYPQSRRAVEILGAAIESVTS